MVSWTAAYESTRCSRCFAFNFAFVCGPSRWSTAQFDGRRAGEFKVRIFSALSGLSLQWLVVRSDVCEG